MGRTSRVRSETVERVTRIELALSAWEVERLPLPGALTWRPWQRSGMTLIDPFVTPANGTLMARRLAPPAVVPGDPRALASPRFGCVAERG